MIKRILVALDPDSDTPAATEFARRIGSKFSAEVTGLAIVDTQSVQSSAKGGGIGSMYLAERVQAQLMDEARTVAQNLVKSFASQFGDEFGGKVSTQIQEGAPVDQVAEEMNYHDLLVIGSAPHFFYSHPHETSLTLQSAIQSVVSPVLVVPEEAFGPVENVLVAYDGSPHSARALRSFLYLKPFGAKVIVRLVNIHESGDATRSKLLLREAETYCELHGFSPSSYSLHSTNPAQAILDTAARYKSQLLVIGAHVVTPICRLLHGSITTSLVGKATLPLWVQS